MNQTSPHRLQIAPALQDFITREALPGTGVSADAFWSGFEGIVRDLGPRNRALLAQRDALQAKIDAWHAETKGGAPNPADYQAFLQSIGYLLPEPPAFSVETSNVDAEIASIAGPQLVVPVSNARYALNAANARWGSLYDALYGTDAIDDADGAARGGGFNAARGAKVVARAKAFLDEAAPLAHGSHAPVVGYAVADGALVARHGGGQTGACRPGAIRRLFRRRFRTQRDRVETQRLAHRGCDRPVAPDRLRRPGGRGGCRAGIRHQHDHGLRG